MKLSFLFIGLILISCSERSSLPEIILSMNAPEAQVKISDLAENIRVIPLETNDSVLISGHPQLVAGKEDIVIINEEEIHQFDSQGKHIRILAKKGKGPEEFMNPYGAKIDNQNRLFYLMVYPASLKIYNLRNGKFTGQKKTSPPIKKILDIRNDTLLYLPLAYRGDTLKYSLCLTNKDNILNVLPCHHVVQDFEPSSNCYLLNDGKIRFQPANHTDSLFTVEQFKTTPYATIKCTNNDDPDFLLSPYLCFENSQWHIFSVTPYAVKRNAQGIVKAVTVKQTSRFITNKQDHNGKLLKELYADPWDIFVSAENLHLSEQQLILPIKAMELKELAEKQLQKGKLSPDLEKIYRNITEEDNPILIIGNCKP